MSEAITIDKPARSLWADAWMRLRANRAAMVGIALLGLVTLLSIFGPMMSPHPHDRVYGEYVGVPARLSPYPASEMIEPAVARVASRMRARGEHCGSGRQRRDRVVVAAADRRSRAGRF